MARIVQLLVSPQHRYDGRPAPEAAGEAARRAELVDHVEIRAGLGIVGDRYFNQRAHRDAAVTLMAVESLAPWPGAGLLDVRRNVLLSGVDVDAGVGRVLELDSGDGPVRFELRRRAHPCAWMDAALAPGAWRALRGRGGVRCVPLDDGRLRVGAVSARWVGRGSVAQVGERRGQRADVPS